MNEDVVATGVGLEEGNPAGRMLGQLIAREECAAAMQPDSPEGPTTTSGAAPLSVCSKLPCSVTKSTTVAGMDLWRNASHRGVARAEGGAAQSPVAREIPRVRGHILGGHQACRDATPPKLRELNAGTEMLRRRPPFLPPLVETEVGKGLELAKQRSSQKQMPRREAHRDEAISLLHVEPLDLASDLRHLHRAGCGGGVKMHSRQSLEESLTLHLGICAMSSPVQGHTEKLIPRAPLARAKHVMDPVDREAVLRQFTRKRAAALARSALLGHNLGNRIHRAKPGAQHSLPHPLCTASPKTLACYKAASTWPPSSPELLMGGAAEGTTACYLMFPTKLTQPSREGVPMSLGPHRGFLFRLSVPGSKLRPPLSKVEEKGSALGFRLVWGAPQHLAPQQHIVFCHLSPPDFIQGHRRVVFRRWHAPTGRFVGSRRLIWGGRPGPRGGDI